MINLYVKPSFYARKKKILNLYSFSFQVASSMNVYRSKKVRTNMSDFCELHVNSVAQ